MLGRPEPKGPYWHATDTEARKRGEQTGLDTLVVHAVNYEHEMDGELSLSVVDNLFSAPPGEYGRKAETQRN